MIGRILGHSKIATTARYAHLAAEPVKYAANDIAKMIAKSMGYNLAGKCAGENVFLD